MIFEYHLKTQKEEMIPIHKQLAEAIEQSGVNNGTALIYCPHTTAAITINENGDPYVRQDLVTALEKFFPKLTEYRHFEGNSAAHFKSSLFGVSETVIITDGKPLLGTWQSPYFCEFDGPRTRRFYIKIEGE
ncbi:MAG: secondary thiamine-phosphate synthase enzyme YjbQ [Eubacteriaceae bacterium]|jgi:secondary thiamine-phosphate synthase enzyme